MKRRAVTLMRLDPRDASTPLASEMRDDDPSPEDIARFGDPYRPCPSCGSEVYDELGVCPACGHDLDQPAERSKAGVIIVVLMLLGLLAPILIAIL